MSVNTPKSTLLVGIVLLVGASANAQPLPSAPMRVAPAGTANTNPGDAGAANANQGNGEAARRDSRDDARPAPPSDNGSAPRVDASQTSGTSTAVDVAPPPSASGSVAPPQGPASESPVNPKSADGGAQPDQREGAGAAASEATEDDDSPSPRSRKKHKRTLGDGEAGDSAWDFANQIRVTGLVHAQFLINEDPGNADFDFRLANARFGVEWRRGKIFDAVGEVELSRDGDRDATAWAPMRDAYVRASLDPRIRLRAGQFKRPFGTLALTPLRDLKLVRRGVSDAWISEELDYGERDVGFQVDGKFGDAYELRYAFGTFNGTGRNHRDNDPNGAKDFVGRIEGRMYKSFTLAVDSSLKYFDTGTFPLRPRSAWMSGASLLVDHKGLYSLVEINYGENYESRAGRHSLAALALIAYKFPIGHKWRLALEPLVKVEELRTEVEVSSRRYRAATAGVNLHAAGVFRLMVQGEWIAPKGPVPATLPEVGAQKCLIVQAAMNTP